MLNFIIKLSLVCMLSLVISTIRYFWIPEIHSPDFRYDLCMLTLGYWSCKIMDMRL